MTMCLIMNISLSHTHRQGSTQLIPSTARALGPARRHPQHPRCYLVNANESNGEGGYASPVTTRDRDPIVTRGKMKDMHARATDTIGIVGCTCTKSVAEMGERGGASVSGALSYYCRSRGALT